VKQFANLLNHVNPDDPGTSINNVKTFAIPQADQVGEQSGPRTIQFVLRIFF
jgi:hypothetical protein